MSWKGTERICGSVTILTRQFSPVCCRFNVQFSICSPQVSWGLSSDGECTQVFGWYFSRRHFSCFCGHLFKDFFTQVGVQPLSKITLTLKMAFLLSTFDSLICTLFCLYFFFSQALISPLWVMSIS